MLKVVVRKIFLIALQFDFASRPTCQTRNISFWSSGSKCLRNGSVLSCYISGYVGLVHEGMIQPSMVTFSQRFASAYANLFAMVIGIIRFYV